MLRLKRVLAMVMCFRFIWRTMGRFLAGVQRNQICVSKRGSGCWWGVGGKVVRNAGVAGTRPFQSVSW